MRLNLTIPNCRSTDFFGSPSKVQKRGQRPLLFSFAKLVGLCAVVATACTVSSKIVAQEPEELNPVDKEIVLFNGKDLKGWTFMCTDENVKSEDVWSVNDEGALVGSGRPQGYLQTKRWYRDYELELKWRWPKEKGGNSGVLVHTTTPLLFFGWPKSMEVQLQSGSAGDFWVIGKGVDIRVEDESERRVKPKAGNQHSHRRIRRLKGDFEKPLGQWNSMKIECRGKEVKVFVNGELVNHGTESTVTEGAIALQSEGTAIEFKEIKLRPLSKKLP